MISLYEIDFSNLNFWTGFITTSFPTALDEETDMSLTELMTENGMCDTSWWDNFTKYYDGVLEESDGYVDEPETIICELVPTQILKIEFHPGDTVYYINDKQIACTGGHYNIQVIPFKKLLNSIKDKQTFLLLLPLAVIDSPNKDEATQIISNILQGIFDKHLCSQYANCIVNGLISE
jgi:hypothetical protein